MKLDRVAFSIAFGLKLVGLEDSSAPYPTWIPAFAGMTGAYLEGLTLGSVWTCADPRKHLQDSPPQPVFSGSSSIAATVSHQNSISNRHFVPARFYCALALSSCIALCGCGTLDVNRLTDRLIASNERDWSPQFRELSTAVIAGDQVTVYNIRNNLYLSEKDFIVQHYDRLFSLKDIQTVDFIVVPFQGMESIAHTMLSFGLADGTYLAVSVEVRTEKGESYTTALGLSHEFELAYVVADERDLIRLRTRHRHAEVYLYPSRATPQQAQDLFVDVMQRANQLAAKPEFYDTIRNNCTNNLVRHVNRVMPNKIPSGWQVLLSGHSDRYAYDLGLLDQRVPFEELKELAHINDLAEANYDAPDFSQKIRSRIGHIERFVHEPTLQDGNKRSAQDTSPAAASSLSRRWAEFRDSLQNQGRQRIARRRPRNGSEIADPVELSIEE